MGSYQIAGLTVQMDISGRTLAQAAPYACQNAPADMVITCDPDVVMAYNPQIADRDLALYMGTGASFARNLLEYDGFQFHASAVSLEGKGYLFTAPSGVGKSTHAEKWVRLFGAKYINDDKPALRKTETGWTVWGTPWSGKHDLSDPKGFPLGGIACLSRGEENRIRRLMPEDAVPYIISQCLRFLTAEQMDKQLKLLDQLLQQVPVWHLICRNEDDAARLSCRVMKEDI